MENLGDHRKDLNSILDPLKIKGADCFPDCCESEYDRNQKEKNDCVEKIFEEFNAVNGGKLFQGDEESRLRKYKN